MSEREISRKTTLENKIFIILLYFWRTLIDRVADMMRVSIKLNVKCVSLQFQSQWDEKTDEIDRETNSVFCFSLCVLRYSYCYSEMWQIVELKVTFDSATQHCRFPLAASHHLCFLSFFSSFPLRIYYADRHTLWISSASLVKQGSDWMMPGCRSSALLKSIFPAAALALASVLLSLDGFLFLSFLTPPDQLNKFGRVFVAACRPFAFPLCFTVRYGEGWWRFGHKMLVQICKTKPPCSEVNSVSVKISHLDESLGRNAIIR